MATSWPWPMACWQSGSASGLSHLELSAWRGRRSGWASHTVLVVPINQDRATMHLDTICTMVDAGVMYPNVAQQLSAIAVRSGNGSGPHRRSAGTLSGGRGSSHGH